MQWKPPGRIRHQFCVRLERFQVRSDLRHTLDNGTTTNRSNLPVQESIREYKQVKLETTLPHNCWPYLSILDGCKAPDCFARLAETLAAARCGRRIYIWLNCAKTFDNSWEASAADPTYVQWTRMLLPAFPAGRLLACTT